MRDELLALVRDTLTFLQDEYGLPSKIENKPLPPPPPAPPPKPVKKKPAPPPVKTTSFDLQKEKPIPTSTFSEMSKLIQKVAPSLTIHEKIPDDAKAKEVKEGWKIRSAIPEVPIFFSQDLHPYRRFLENIAGAIEKAFCSSRLIPIEKEIAWDIFFGSNTLRLIIAVDTTIFHHPYLMERYREFPNEGKRFLENVPVLLLPDLSLYFKDPILKRSLWNVICQKLQV